MRRSVADDYSFCVKSLSILGIDTIIAKSRLIAFYRSKPISNNAFTKKMNLIRAPFFYVFAFLALTVRRLALAAVTAFALLSGQSHAMSFNIVAPVLYLGGSVVPDDWAAW